MQYLEAGPAFREKAGCRYEKYYKQVTRCSKEVINYDKEKGWSQVVSKL